MKQKARIGQLDAFTIVESIMAMIVIMVSFTAGISIYLSMLQGDAFPLKTKARNALNTVFVQTKAEQRFLDESLTLDGFLVEKKVTDYKHAQAFLKQEHVYELQLKAFSPNEELIATQRHLIHLVYEH